MVEKVARYGLGLILLVMGLNYYLHIVPMPAMSPQGGLFISTLINTGYLFTIVKVIEIIAGVLLLANRYINFAVVIIAPVIVNIILFHLFLDTSGLPMAVIVAVAYGVVLNSRKRSLSGLLKP